MPAVLDFTVNPEFAPWLDRKAEYVLDASASVYAGEVRRRMESSEPAGRWYRSRRGAGQWHHASAPDQPPAIDVGTLVRSIATSGAGSGFARVVEAGTMPVDQPDLLAIWLELGTRTILPRPAWLRALDAVRGRLGSPE